MTHVFVIIRFSSISNINRSNDIDQSIDINYNFNFFFDDELVGSTQQLILLTAFISPTSFV